MKSKDLILDSALELEQQCWLIHSILQTLYVALPDDASDSDLPTRTVVGGLVDMVADLAEALTAMQCWLIHSILQTLYVALPDDDMNSDLPTRTVVGGLVDMVAGLAEGLAAMSDVPAPSRSDCSSNEGGRHG